MELRCGFEGPLRLGSYLSFSLISCLFRIVLVCGGGGFDPRALEVGRAGKSNVCIGC